MNTAPLVIVRDTREPYPHHRAAEWLTCDLCGAASYRDCEPVFNPWTWGPCKRDMPYDDRPRVYPTTERAKLDVGDYAVKGLERFAAFERKSGADLLNTFFGWHLDSCGDKVENGDRFRRELERARVAGMRLAIVVETDVAGIYRESRRRWDRYGKGFDAARVEEWLQGLWLAYGVPTIWAGSKGAAERMVGWALTRVWEQASGGKAGKDAARRGETMAWLGALDGAEVTG